MEHYNPKRPTIRGIKKLRNHVSVIGTTAYYAPISQGNSASRLMMATVQSQQLLGPRIPDVPIVLSGGEGELGKYTFDNIIEYDASVFDKIPYYKSFDSKDIPFTLILRNEETGEYDFMDVTPYMHNHTKFGHKKVFEPRVKTISPGELLFKGERLTRTANVHEGEIYSSTLNCKTFYCSSLGTTEDGFEVTPEFIYRSAPLAVGETTASYGAASFPIYIYGTEANPRPFPKQGERLRDDGMVYCLREYDEDWDFLITHKSQLDKPDRVFDACMHAEPGAEITDVEVLTTTSEGKRPVTNKFISETLEVYSNRKIEYSKRLLQAYTRIKQDSNAKISLRLMRKFAEAFIVSPNSSELISLLPPLERHKVLSEGKRNRVFIRTKKNAELDEWTVKLTYAYRFHVTKGAKFSDKHGNKGVICNIRPSSEMFRDEYGNVADMTIFTKAPESRMNKDQKLEHLIGGFLFAIQYDCRAMIEENRLDDAFQHIMNAYQIVAPLTYEKASKIFVTRERQHQHVMAVCAPGKDIHVTILADSAHVNELMYKAIMEYRPPLVSTIHFVNRRGKPDTLIKKGLIAPKCVGILEKTQHNKLAENTALTQHHGLPTSSSPKGEHSGGIKQLAPKVASETEGRAWAATVGSIVVGQMMDQANSSLVSEEISGNMFDSDNPLGEPVLVDRNKIPSGTNSALQYIEHLFSCEGTEILGNTPEELSKSIQWDK